MLSIRSGDIFAQDSGIIIHGCNTAGVMGAGVAKLVREIYPLAYLKYRELVTSCKTATERSNLLGTAQFVEVTPSLIIGNVFTQFNPGADATLTNLRKGLAAVKDFSKKYKIDAIHSVMIGCGIGGLDEGPVLSLYKSEFYNFDGICNLWIKE